VNPSPNAPAAPPPAPRSKWRFLGPSVHVLLAVAWVGVQLYLIFFGLAVGADMVFSHRTAGDEARLGFACLLIGLVPRPLLSTIPLLTIPFVFLLSAAIATGQASLLGNGNDNDIIIGNTLLVLQLLRVDACLLLSWWVVVLGLRHRPTAWKGIIVQWWR
jgi:hypothetical protein